MSLAPGTRLGPYETGGILGAGGMGEVYKALDTRLGRTVAIKVLAQGAAADPDRRRRFEREARAVSALNHPHICTLLDVGSEAGIDFLAMECLEGQTLAERLAKTGGKAPALRIEEALELGIQIADAPAKAHRQGIVHRDLKPANVMLAKAGATRPSGVQAKLLDFGLAKLKPAGALAAGAAGEFGGRTRLARVLRTARSAGGGRTALALSFDGRRLVFVARNGDVQQLYVRALDEDEARPLTGTLGAEQPFFSPDGRWIGFWAEGQLRKVPSQGGPATPICDAPGSAPDSSASPGPARSRTCAAGFRRCRLPRSSPLTARAPSLRCRSNRAPTVPRLVARFLITAVFGRRCIPAGGVASRSNIPDILARRAWPAGRLVALDTSP